MDKILRHFEVRDLEQIRRRTGPQLDTFDGFVYGHIGTEEDTVRELQDAGKMSLRYFNVLTMPAPDWHDPWFDYVRSSVVPLRRADGLGAYFPSQWEYGARALWDWSLWTRMRLKNLARKIRELSGPEAGVFLDQFWMMPRDWMFGDRTPEGLEAAKIEDFPGSKWYRWERMIGDFLTMLRQMIAPHPVVVNGDRTPSPPIYLEHPEWYPLDHEEQLYLEHESTVLAPFVEVDWSVDWGLALWKGSGKWIAFTTRSEGAALEEAYARAHVQRSAVD